MRQPFGTRRSQKNKLLIDQLQQETAATDRGLVDDREIEIKEKMLTCLEQCTDKLDPLNRRIISQYYVGKERAKIDNRRALAETLGITMNALSIRACRIRDKLEACVRQCVNG